MANCIYCKTKFKQKYITYRYCESTDECKEAGLNYKIQKAIEQGRKNLEKEKKEKDKKAKTDLLSNDAFRAKKIQPVINEIARIIDFGQPCIATQRYNGKMAGGHFISVGANRASALNLHNIHKQCFESNGMSGGDPLLYRENLIKIYGIYYCVFVQSFRRIERLGLSRQELENIFEKAKKIRNRLKKDERILTPKERISLRNSVNNELGIYTEIYSQFNIK